MSPKEMAAIAAEKRARDNTWCESERMAALLSTRKTEEKSPNDWNCSLCTFRNSGLLLNCEMCSTERAYELGKDTNDPLETTKPRLNSHTSEPKSSLQYESESKKNSKPKIQPPARKIETEVEIIGWICPQCTFMNKGHVSICEICMWQNEMSRQNDEEFDPFKPLFF